MVTASTYVHHVMQLQFYLYSVHRHSHTYAIYTHAHSHAYRTQNTTACKHWVLASRSLCEFLIIPNTALLQSVLDRSLLMGWSTLGCGKSCVYNCLHTHGHAWPFNYDSISSTCYSECSSMCALTRTYTHSLSLIHSPHLCLLVALQCSCHG